MEDKRSIYKTIINHVLFWLIFIFIQCVALVGESQSLLSAFLDVNLISLISIEIAVSYFNMYFLLPMFYHSQKPVSYVFYVVTSVFLGALLQRYCELVFWAPWDRSHDPARAKYDVKEFWLPLAIVSTAFRAFPPVAFTTIIKVMRRTLKNERHLREMEKEKTVAEMSLLKAQINPHFFFNTLNSLYSLTIDTSIQASKVVVRLSELMHYMLYKTSSNMVLLLDEIAYIENYIGIEQMRFSDRLEISFQYSGEMEEKTIAPLLLLPFVENAFKHGNTDTKGWITINLKLQGNLLILKVKNSYKSSAPVNSSGLGLTNVQRRLELTYPGKFDLQLKRDEEFFEVDLKLEI